MPLKPWTGWSANGGVNPLTGAVPSGEPDGSLAGTKVSAGSAANVNNSAWPHVFRSAAAAVAAPGSVRVRATTAAVRPTRLLTAINPHLSRYEQGVLGPLAP